MECEQIDRLLLFTQLQTIRPVLYALTTCGFRALVLLGMRSDPSEFGIGITWSGTWRIFSAFSVIPVKVERGIQSIPS